MAIDTKAKPVPLNRVTHGLRVSQLIYQYGPGGMVDFPDQTLMTAAPEYWAEQVERIHDERLERALKVDYFGMPSSEEGKQMGVSYVRFPEWYFCPKCRSFKPIGEWVREYQKSKRAREKDPDMVKNIRCPKCWQPLVVSRIVNVCENGHIDDFPWVEWVHARSYKGREVCSNPRLKMMTASSSSEGLEGISVVCEYCNAKATLSGAFDKDIFSRLYEKWKGKYDFTCSGRHPWKHTCEKCAAFPRTMQRGSSSIYFPVTVASLVIPPYSSLLTSQIEESAAFARCRDMISSTKDLPGVPPEMKLMIIQNQINSGAESIAFEIGSDKDTVAEILRRKWMQGDTEEEVSDFSYRAEEYDALSGRTHVHHEDYDGDFIRESTDPARYNLPFVKSVSLITKVREVIALIGFTRINPQDSELSATRPLSFVSIKEKKTNWYPAYQVRGEGIFIEFNEEDIDSWAADHPEVRRRAEQLNQNYARSMFGDKHPRKISAKYLLLHTLSHLLIKQLSFECGYGIASLKERIYSGETTDGKQMAGILIYTAGGDSEGTLGGLVRQGRHDIFPRVFRKAIETARICSGDPVCSLSNGQGRDSLNLAACYSCALIPETSCEDFNAFLDRGVVVGTMKRPDMGFFAEQLREGWGKAKIYVPHKKKEVVPAVSSQGFGTIIPVRGTELDTTGMQWDEIWEMLEDYADEDEEQAALEQVKAKASMFSGKEQPLQDCRFRLSSEPDALYEANLLWQESHVAVFMNENTEAYEKAAKTDWHCYMITDSSLSSGELANLLKEAH